VRIDVQERLVDAEPLQRQLETKQVRFGLPVINGKNSDALCLPRPADVSTIGP